MGDSLGDPGSLEDAGLHDVKYTWSNRDVGLHEISELLKGGSKTES